MLWWFLPYIDMNQPWIDTCSPPRSPSHLSHNAVPLGLPSAPAPSTCLMHPTWVCSLCVFLHCTQAHLYPFSRLHIYMLISKSYLQCVFYYYYFLSLGSQNVKHTCIQDKHENKKIHPKQYVYPVCDISNISLFSDIFVG